MLESVNSLLFQGVSVDGVTVSIVAFQAAVPGSTPGRRKTFLNDLYIVSRLILKANRQ